MHSMKSIHTTAVIHEGAELAADVQVGPYAVIGPHVKIGAGTTIGSHAVIDGHTTIGRHNRIFSFASIGQAPQDKKYNDEPCELHMGARNTIREFCTFNIGSPGGGGLTRLGDDNWIMAYVHVAHDCLVGHHTIIANATQLGGHVHIGDWVVLGGLTGVHQFVRVGAHAMAGFQTRLSQDVPPFVNAVGNPAQAQGINAEGLRRRGYTDERITQIKRMYRALYRQGLSLADAKASLLAMRGASPETDGDLDLLVSFLDAAERGIVR
jgi:UDP-N-acetylglucosamine acyltransferase